MEGENKMLLTPHVVVVPYPSQGHINPLLQFAKRLASKGVKATLATTKYTLKSISSIPNIAVEPISDGFDIGGFSQAGSEDSFLGSFKSNGSISLANIIESHKNTSCPITCVVYDAFLVWALDVAIQYGLYGAAFFTNSGTVSAIFANVSNGSMGLPIGPDDLGLALPKMPKFKARDLPSFLKQPVSYPAYLAMKLNQFSNLDLAHWTFCNSFDDLELEVLEGAMEKWPAKLIGPMVPSAYLDGRIEEDVGYGASLWKPLNSECKAWLQTMPTKSVVYISFGSMVSLTSEQTEELAWGLKESNFPYLWVIRESQMSTLPQWFKDECESNKKGMIVTWCNQLEVLDHEATSCFVTHCGWNSTLEGLSLGIPMVGIPQWSDQLTNAKFIEEVWGVGVRAKEDDKGVVRRREFGRCLEEVMGGNKGSENIRKNVSKWKKLAKRAISHGGSSDKHIDNFVAHLQCANNAKANAKFAVNNGILGKVQLN